MLLAWTPFMFSKNGFPRDDNAKPYIPGNLIKDAIANALIFYYIKKDKQIENKVKKYLMGEKVNLKEISQEIKNIVFSKYPYMDNLEVPDIIYLDPEKISIEVIDIYDVKKGYSIDDFKAEVFQGSLDINISSPYLSKIKAAAHSFVEALINIEKKLLNEHLLIEKFYNPLSNEIKKWEIPLRIGMWSEDKRRAKLLFFWRIKEVREKLIKHLNYDILPSKILFLPSKMCTLGWSEYK